MPEKSKFGIPTKYKNIVIALGKLDRDTAPEGMGEDVTAFVQAGSRVAKKLWAYLRDAANQPAPPPGSPE